MLDRRRMTLSGGRNLRDLGGYLASDGQTVEWGRLFRSGTPVHLTTGDIEWFEEVGVHTIYDLRDTRERNDEPHPKSLRVALHSLDYDLRDLQPPMMSMDPRTQDLRALMREFYAMLPWTLAPHLRALFGHVAAGDLPLLINCAAGKDRTGLASALLLTAVGVPRVTVLEDYALSDQYIDFERDLVQARLKKGKADATGFQQIARLSVAERAPLFRSDPDYLVTAFDTIEARHGTLEAYFQEELGMDESKLARIRDNLLATTQ